MAIESVKNPEDEELIRKWQADYFEEKQKELEEKRAKKFSDKKSKNKIVEQQEKKDQEEKVRIQNYMLKIIIEHNIADVFKISKTRLKNFRSSKFILNGGQ